MFTSRICTYFWNVYQSGTFDVESIDDVKENSQVRRVLASLLTPPQIEGLYSTLSGVLLCGNIMFKNTTKMGTDM